MLNLPLTSHAVILELVTDIFAYVASAGDAGISGAAIYADNGGSPGALVATTNKVTVGTCFFLG